MGQDDGSESSYFHLTVVLGILIIYVTFQAVIEYKKIHIIHETGLGILMGMLFGFCLYEYAEHKDEQLSFDFNGNFFFTYILPPIIFAGGYNLKKDKFFKNMFYINLYAVLGTMINFGITLGLMILFNNAKLFNTVKSDNDYIELSTQTILFFAGTMCASDAIAALTLISSDKYPKLFSVVFGEGLLNDAVSIILFHSIQKIQGSFSGSQAASMIGNFFLTCIVSILVGAIIGLVTTVFFKFARFLSHNPTVETVLIFVSGYFTYSVVELMEFSGVIAMLTCAILMSHYLSYNLSQTGLISSSITIQSISSIAEAFLFVYLGINFWEYFSPKQIGSVSFSFIGLGFLAVVIARIFCIFGTSGLGWLCKRKKWRLNFWEMSIIWFAGMIRGAVAFALIQTVSSESIHPTDNCDSSCQNVILKSSIMFIVFFTTIVMGATMPFYVSVHIKQIEKLEAKEKEQNEQEETEKKLKIEEELREKLLQEQNNNNEEEIEKIRIETEVKKKYRGACLRRFKQLEENHIKPILIYDYKQRKAEIKKQKELIRANAKEEDGNQQLRTLARIQNDQFKQSAISNSNRESEVSSLLQSEDQQNLDEIKKRVQNGNEYAPVKVEPADNKGISMQELDQQSLQ